MLNLSQDLVSSLSPEKKSEVLQLVQVAQYRWTLNARPSQLAPEGDWTTWLIKTGRGWGKMIDINTDIRTTEGWKKLADVKSGDYVFNLQGKPVRVLMSHDIREVDAYELIFDTGEKIRACAEHLWYTESKIEDRRIRRGTANLGSVKTTAEVAYTIKCGSDLRETNHRIPISAAISYHKKSLPIDPYVLGAWLGDGASAGAEITCADNEILRRIEELGYTTRNTREIQYLIGEMPPERDVTNGRFTDNGSFHSKLKGLNLIHNKHIPAIYLNASIDQRLELLKGLMDTDGHCEKNGWCEFVTIKKHLADETYELISSLGIKTRIYECPSMFYGKYKGQKYRIFFKSDIPVFSLSRKAERQANATKAQMSRHKNRFIVDAVNVGKTKMRCLTVDSQDGLFLITKSFIATHNTRVGAETVRVWKDQMPIFHFIGATAGDARDIMIEGPAGILACSPPWDMPRYEPSKRKVTWKNGARALIFTADEPDRLRGPQCHAAWCDELAAWRYAEESWDNMMMGLRLGTHPRVIATTTPRPTKMIRDLMKDPTVHVTSGTTYENLANLAPSFLSSIIKKYEGTRLGRQELNAELLEDIEGALWNLTMIDKARVSRCPELVKLGIAIDPSVTSTDTSDECGIMIGGIDAKGEIYILEDKSDIMSPITWAGKAIDAYYKQKADRIIGETNNGGDLIETVLRQIDRNVAYTGVWASRGKVTRAEPVQALYEQRRVHHVGSLPKLEDEMCTWIPKEGKSPNRIDALVWLVFYLIGDDNVSDGIVV